MPLQSKAQGRFLNWKFGHDWVKEHHFGGKQTGLPDYARNKLAMGGYIPGYLGGPSTPSRISAQRRPQLQFGGSIPFQNPLQRAASLQAQTPGTTPLQPPAPFNPLQASDQGQGNLLGGQPPGAQNRPGFEQFRPRFDQFMQNHPQFLQNNPQFLQNHPLAAKLFQGFVGQGQPTTPAPTDQVTQDESSRRFWLNRQPAQSGAAIGPYPSGPYSPPPYQVMPPPGPPQPVAIVRGGPNPPTPYREAYPAGPLPQPPGRFYGHPGAIGRPGRPGFNSAFMPRGIPSQMAQNTSMGNPTLQRGRRTMQGGGVVYPPEWSYYERAGGGKYDPDVPR